MTTIQADALLDTITESLIALDAQDTGFITDALGTVSKGFHGFVFAAKPVWRHPKLSLAQDADLVARTQDGDPRASKLLIDRCAPLLEAYSALLLDQNPGTCPNALMAAGHMGIVDALRAFTPESNTLFTTFCRYAVASHMLMASKDVHVGITGVQRNKRRTHIRPIDTIAATATATTAPRQDRSLITLLNEAFMEAYAQATPRQQVYLDIFKQPEGREMTLESVGQQMSLSKERVRQLRNRCFALFRNALAHKGITAPHDAV